MKKSSDTYGWMQDLKDLVEAERSLEITPYISTHFELKRKNTYDGQVLHPLDMPRSMLDRWRWLIRWREARFQCAYSRDNVRCSSCFYDKKSGLSLEWNSILNRLSSAKAQIAIDRTCHCGIHRFRESEQPVF